jgi:hypothetical protein
VSLDRFDEDPAGLVSVLAAAYARISGHPDLSADVGGVASLRPGPRRPPARISVQTSTYPSCSSRDTSATTTGLDRAITEFSAGYADQDSRDYEAFVKVVSDGRLEAVHGL